MIDRREIIDAGTKYGLNPHVVEKDLILGWVLAGIYAHDELAESWIFKGGTCLKKCYFETYRFSEDLDFTLTDPDHIDEAFLRRTLGEVGEWVYETTGIELPAEKQDFDFYQNPRGNPSCQGKLSYCGPISPRSGGWPRIKLDLTADERVVLPPVRIPIFHPYSDAPVEGIHVLSYAYEEAFGEKVRALAERARPRDLYDVINLFRNDEARPSPSVLLDVLRQKCEFKGINVPRIADMETHRATLEGGWGTMLAHQLPALPPVNAFWDELPTFFAWLEGGQAPVVPAAVAMDVGETVLRERSLRLPVSGPAQSYIEVIRFAASNRLCVQLDYQGTTRRIEPYSLRQTRDGNIVLHAFNVDRNEHRSYRVDRIAGARTTNQTFIPRYEIELTPHGPVRIAPTVARSSSGLMGGFGRARRARVSTSWSNGPTYVYECPYCGKRFNRKRQDSKLNPHKNKHGFPCSGRHGMYVDTRF
jgi:predicted nucleotidyltransferase component of viral defense system